MVNFFSKKQQDRNLLIYLMEKLEIIFARKMIAWQKFLEKKSAIIILGQRRGPRGIAESAKVSSYTSMFQLSYRIKQLLEARIVKLRTSAMLLNNGSCELRVL